MNASENPGCDWSSGTAFAHSRAIVGETMKPSAAYLIAGSKRSANGSFPNFSERSHPRAHRARHGHGIPAALRHRRHAFEAIERPARWRAAGRVEAVQLLAVPQDAERVAADAVARRLDHGQRDRGRERRIDGVPPFQQHAQARLRCKRLRGRDDVAREHRHALRRIGKLPVEEFHGGEWRGKAMIIALRSPRHGGPECVLMAARHAPHSVAQVHRGRIRERSMPHRHSVARTNPGAVQRVFWIPDACAAHLRDDVV